MKWIKALLSLFRERRRKKTPTLIQMENTECGAACLGSILAYYGRYVPLEELRVACGVSRDGSSAYGIVKASESYGLDCEGYSFTIEELKQQPLPCILYWGFDHFVILEQIEGSKYYINDPAVGHLTLDESEFKMYFTGVLLQLKPNSTFKSGGVSPSLLGSLKRRLKPVYGVFALLTLLQLGLVFLTLVVIVLAQVFVDHILTAQFPQWYYWFLGIAAGTVLFISLLTFLEKLMLVKAQIKLATQYSAEFFMHIFKLPISFFAQRYSSEIAYRSSLNQHIADFFTGHLFEVMVQFLMVFIYGIAIFFFSISIGIVALLCGSLNLITIYLIRQYRINAYARYQQEMGRTAAFSISALEGFETWKSLGIENRLFSWLAALYTRCFNVLHGLQNTDQVLAIVSYCSQITASIALFALGGWFLIEGTLTPGQFLALLLLVSLFLEPIVRLVEINKNFELFFVDLARLDDVMNYPVDWQFRQKNQHLEKLNFENIKFSNVSYSYNVNHPPIIHSIDLSIGKGQCIALVGATGSGKTTILKMLTGLILPEKGEITIDGIPLKDVSPEPLSKHMAFVFDTSFIFEDTVRRNLTLYDNNISDKAFNDALRDACLVERFSEGLDEVLEEEGRNISGGEKQRLEIARCLMREPSFIALDEATSSLDEKTEGMVLNNIRRRGYTTLLLTHRLSAINLCDQVYVLDQGTIVQKGTPQELAKAEGPYKKMLIDELA